MGLQIFPHPSPCHKSAPTKIREEPFKETITTFPQLLEFDQGTPIFAREVRVDRKIHDAYPNSRIVVLGDSMILMYSDPQAADLGAHTSARVGYPCEVIAKGSGSPLVPRMFYSRYGTDRTQNDPKIVVWCGVSRHQGYVPIDSGTPPEFSSGIYEVSVVAVPKLPDPTTAPYPHALFAFKASIRLEESVSFPAKIYARAFTNRERTKMADLAVGDTRPMRLTNWTEAIEHSPRIKTMASIDEMPDLSLPEFFWDED